MVVIYCSREKMIDSAEVSSHLVIKTSWLTFEGFICPAAPPKHEGEQRYAGVGHFDAWVVAM